MEPIPPKQQDMIDVTDSLEAVDAARSMRFFLFWFVLFPALLILQVIFWLNFAGLVEQKDAPAKSAVSWLNAIVQYAPVYLAAEVPATEPQDQTTESARQPAQEPVTEPAQQPQEQPAETSPDVPREDIQKGVDEVTGEEDDMAAVQSSQEEPAKNTFFKDAKLPYALAKGIVQFCNYLILFAAILYCLILLLCLKISLVGRLGGLFHITKAFLISLLFLIVLVPWQVILPRVMIGALWLPSELFGGWWDRIDDSIFWKVFYFLRFTGMWLLAVVFLFWSRTRFVKWRRATLRRLGVLR